MLNVKKKKKKKKTLFDFQLKSNIREHILCKCWNTKHFKKCDFNNSSVSETVWHLLAKCTDGLFNVYFTLLITFLCRQVFKKNHKSMELRDLISLKSITYQKPYHDCRSIILNVSQVLNDGFVFLCVRFCQGLWANSLMPLL